MGPIGRRDARRLRGTAEHACFEFVALQRLELDVRTSGFESRVSA